MARKTPKKTKQAVKLRERPGLLVRWLLRYVLRGVLIVIALAVVATLAFSAVNPPTTPYMFAEGRRVGGVNQTWVPMEQQLLRGFRCPSLRTSSLLCMLLRKRPRARDSMHNNIT